MQKNMLLAWILVVSLVFAFGAPGFAQNTKPEPLSPGMKASTWSFKDSEGKTYSMDNWPGEVLVINYVDPDESEANEPFNEALKKAKNEDKTIDEAKFQGIGIADCAATWLPNIAIRKIAGRKAKKYKTTILFDYDAVLRNQWGLKKDTSNIIVLDKNRVCQAVVRGPVPTDKISELVQLVINLQNQK